MASFKHQISDMISTGDYYVSIPNLSWSFAKDNQEDYAVALEKIAENEVYLTFILQRFIDEKIEIDGKELPKKELCVFVHCPDGSEISLSKEDLAIEYKDEDTRDLIFVNVSDMMTEDKPRADE